MKISFRSFLHWTLQLFSQKEMNFSINNRSFVSSTKKIRKNHNKKYFNTVINIEILTRLATRIVQKIKDE